MFRYQWFLLQDIKYIYKIFEYTMYLKKETVGSVFYLFYKNGAQK